MRGVLIGLVLMLAASPAAGADEGKQFDGTSPVVEIGNKKPALPMQVRLVIGPDVKVYYCKADACTEVKPGAFKITRVKSNAVVLAMDSGGDKDGEWVETWEYTLTLRDNDTLMALWTRAVNNVGLPLSSDASKFVIADYGKLKRAP